MTGANFVVAETGTFVVCTNEGNADLSANVPKLHIASIGIEKIIPRLEDLACSSACSRAAHWGRRFRNTRRIFAVRATAARCTSCWSTTDDPLAWAWPSSGRRSNASSAPPA
jgi:L-lactate utilization protein LutB